jgi:hypothetical protein
MNRIFAIFAAALLTSCATTKHQFAAPGSDWKSATGQLRYMRNSTAIIGDLTVSRGPAGAHVEFVKSGLVLMRVTRDATHIRFDGPLARGTREYPLSSDLHPDLAPWRKMTDAVPGTHSLPAAGESVWNYQLPPLR